MANGKSWETRERLREKGQFWTPPWVAEAMVEYVLADGAKVLFDPAVGAGAFFRAARAVAGERGLYLCGMEIDPSVVEEGLGDEVRIGDFLAQPPRTKFPAIVANPPYVRHHRLGVESKARLRQLATLLLGKPLDGRAGLHVYFLIQALELLEENGRLAFILPADTCEGKFAPELWDWIARSFALDAIVTFAPEATPFPGVDTNPLVFFIRKAPPKSRFLWARCYRSGGNALRRWVQAGLSEVRGEGLVVISRELDEGLSSGLSREPSPEGGIKYVLGDFARVMRGVATGANDFFFMTRERARRLGIPEECFVRAIGRTRDVPGNEVSLETLEALERQGRPTLLLALRGEDLSAFPEAVRRYLREGERLGLPERPLLAQRRPWYRMETRTPPPFLFTYLGRRSSRFVRNAAGVVPLTGFLCVYPRADGEEHLERIWRMINHPDTLGQLSRIAKSYGHGAIKVEPRMLERLPIPEHVVEG